MRILLISLPRTGSNSLMKRYADEFNLKMIGEPFNSINDDNSFKLDDNVIIKTIINQKPKNVNNCFDFYLNFSKNFDKVILLSRKDKDACAESLAFLNYHEKDGFKYNEKYEWYETPNISISKTFIVDCEKELIKLSNSLMIDIIYYEDIFEVNSKDRLRLRNLKSSKLL
jgi:hypothetical protein